MSKDKDIDQESLFYTMPLPRLVFTCGSDSIYTIAASNNQAAELFDVKADKLKGIPVSDLLDKGSAKHLIKSLDKARIKKETVTIEEFPDITGGEKTSSLMIFPVMDDKGDVIMLDVIAMPVFVAEDSVLQRERDDAISLLTSVFDVSEVGIVVTDRHERIIRVNDSFSRIYGWDREDLMGKEFSGFVAEEERELSKKRHDEFMEGGIRSSGEMKLMCKDGSFAHALFTTAALELSNGRRFQVTTIMDITMRKQMELSLRVAKEQADAASHAKSMFLANMSHELRTPLNAIIGFSEMMIKGTYGKMENEKYEEYLSDIHLSARHLLEVINEVLDMSKIEAGRVELHEEYFDIRTLINSVIRMMVSRAISSGLKLKEEHDPELPPLYADPRLVRQVLINLIGNAVKYSKNGGVITIGTKLSKYNNLIVTVHDTGIGIPADRIREALEPFGQINDSYDSDLYQGTGTGLGLPLAKAMMELHEGELTLESEEGKGTTARIEFLASRLSFPDTKGKHSPLASFRQQKEKDTIEPDPELARKAE